MRRRELLFLLAGAMSATRDLRAQQNALPLIGFLGTATSRGRHLSPLSSRDWPKPATSRDKTWRSNIVGRRVAMIGCPLWPPNSSNAVSM